MAPIKFAGFTALSEETRTNDLTLCLLAKEHKSYVAKKLFATAELKFSLIEVKAHACHEVLNGINTLFN